MASRVIVRREQRADSGISTDEFVQVALEYVNGRKAADSFNKHYPTTEAAQNAAKEAEWLSPYIGETNIGIVYVSTDGVQTNKFAYHPIYRSATLKRIPLSEYWSKQESDWLFKQQMTNVEEYESSITDYLHT